jgi:hypothetical protein
VTKPAGDKTPPTLRWVVINKATNVQTKINGTGTINANVGDSFTVMAIAEDPQGIHQITLGASTGWTCRQGEVAQAGGPGLGVQQTQTLQPNAQNEVLTEIFIIDNAQMGPFKCEPGFKFAGGSTQFIATGTNYGNQTVNATLSIDVGG